MKLKHGIALCCAFSAWTSGLDQVRASGEPNAAREGAGQTSVSVVDYVGQSVPFARAASGIRIYGDAWTWWDQAAGKYERGSEPRVGAVVVFVRSDKLRLGHVAVVSRIVERRVLTLTHANWSRSDVGGHLEQDVTLFDVSPKNDWTQVKVQYRNSFGLGKTIYPVYGFIYSPNGAIKPEKPDYAEQLIDTYNE